jgi:hypothetical protein
LDQRHWRRDRSWRALLLRAARVDQFHAAHGNPYLGIFTYLVAPGFLIAGLALIFFGAWAQRRWAIKHATTKPDKWRLSFSQRADRRHLL